MSESFTDLPSDVTGWIEILRRVKTRRAELDLLETQAREKIQAALGNTEEGRLDGQPVVRWTHTAAPRRFDKTRFQKEHPKLYDQYIQAGEPGRRFTLIDPAADEAATRA